MAHATLTFALRDSASAFGLAHLVFEGVYVGVLAGLEWRFRGDVSSTA